MAHAAVLVPGTLCDARLFGAMIEAMAIPASVADLSGHDRVATAAVDILAHALPRFVAIGFSLGGFVVLEMLRRSPERVSGVVLLSGNAHPDDPANAATRRADVAHARDVGMARFVEQNWPRYVGAGARGDCAMQTLIGAMAAAIGHEDHARQSEMNIHRPDFRDMVATPPVPVLVVAGTEDALCPQDRYVAAAQGGRLERVAGAGHFLPLEAPARVAAIVSDWLAHEVAA